MLWHTSLFDSIALNGTSTVSDFHVEIGSPGEECSVTEALQGIASNGLLLCIHPKTPQSSFTSTHQPSLLRSPHHSK
jgi:hypothetical protein